MSWVFNHLWLIPALPLVAAGVSALAKQRQRTLAAGLAIISLALSLVLSCLAFFDTLAHSGHAGVSRQVRNLPWFQLADGWVSVGWVLDPLTAVMLVMVCFVGLLIFIYSVGYMAHDENFTRFFCFLSLFAAAMLGVIIANSLLVFFICWELVGLTSYLLIGFWYHKPSASAAAKKAFITTRVGDLALLLGMVWLYAQTGTLLFYDHGRGCLESSAVTALFSRATANGLLFSTAIGLLIFLGAMGKSGQVPLHVWLPDAMEGPTPVSALIHAATMVAAGVFLVARVYPLMAPIGGVPLWATALPVITWVGAITAVFAASIAVAQTDIKRILAYSTVSQLGFMMMGLGVGGVAVGVFHLITHAFFKALLFMGAGSVIHGCHEEQDIRRMGGLRRFMPITFATYAVGMLALSGFPLFFSGFWSKDEILHAAHGWKLSHGPFYLGVLGALLTAFYMTRQVCYVFFGESRLNAGEEGHPAGHGHAGAVEHPHESPGTMTLPLVVLAACSIALGFVGTPAWPWFQGFLDGEPAKVELSRIFERGVMLTMLMSTVVVFVGLAFGYWLYGRRSIRLDSAKDVLEARWPEIFTLLSRKYYVDEAYEWAIVGFNAWWSRACDWLDRWVWGSVVALVSWAVVGLSWINRLVDEFGVNLGFDEICRRLPQAGSLVTLIQDGRVQHYLRIIGIGLIILTLALVWGCRAS
jgi:NADH-quinone oxidoreductase subunit L